MARVEVMIDERYRRDIERNIYVSPLRKKRWLFFFLRKEQAASLSALRKLYALGKKVALAGTGCEFPASAIRGGGLRIPHLNGIIISPVAKVGADCTIFHQVTLGVNGRKSLGVGPTLGDRVSIGTGAKIIGPVRIGDDVTIGANAVVTKDIPNGATVVGYNKVIKEESNGRGTSE